MLQLMIIQIAHHYRRYIRYPIMLLINWNFISACRVFFQRRICPPVMIDVCLWWKHTTWCAFPESHQSIPWTEKNGNFIVDESLLKYTLRLPAAFQIKRISFALKSLSSQISFKWWKIIFLKDDQIM